MAKQIACECGYVARATPTTRWSSGIRGHMASDHPRAARDGHARRPARLDRGNLGGATMATATTFDPQATRRRRGSSGRTLRRRGTAGGRRSRSGSARRPRRCSTSPTWRRAAACSTSPRARAARRWRRRAASDRRRRPRDRHLAEASSSSRPPRRGAPGSRTSRCTPRTARSSTSSRARSTPRSRALGLIYFPDRAAGAREHPRRRCGPAGASRRSSYSTPERNGFFSVPVGIIRRRAELPPPAPGSARAVQPRPPGVLEAELDGRRLRRRRRAGGRRRRCGWQSAAECARFERESFGALHQMLAGLPTRPSGRASGPRSRRRFGQFEGPDGFVGPCELLVVGATASPAIEAPCRAWQSGGRPTPSCGCRLADDEPERGPRGILELFTPRSTGAADEDAPLARE